VPNLFLGGSYRILYHNVNVTTGGFQSLMPRWPSVKKPFVSLSCANDNAEWCLVGDFTIENASPVHILFDITSYDPIDAILIYKKK
jgi:hypothetical protein